MPRFFVSDPIDRQETVTLFGEDAAHIARSLRMTVGEALTLCDGVGTDYSARILSVSPNAVELAVEGSAPSRGEPSVAVTLFQGLPKGEKMDWIVQKAVELGVTRIVPYLAVRSISRPDGGSAQKKAQRWQKIADEAAKQSQRGILPQVSAPVSFAEAMEQTAALQKTFLLYEGGGVPLREQLSPVPASVGMFVGPEGGFAPEEVETLRSRGAAVITLGTRILRTETAPLAALTALMFATGNLE